jgi:L-asparagine transporter-like permease
MELSLPITLAIAMLTMAMFVFASWRARQPSQPLKVRMINYHVVQLVCIVVLLLMLAHLMTLLTGPTL